MLEEEGKLERDMRVTQANNKDILASEQLRDLACRFEREQGRRPTRELVAMQLEWNPCKWDPTAEWELESDEEVELSLPEEGTGATRAHWDIVQDKDSTGPPSGAGPKETASSLKISTHLRRPCTPAELVELTAKFHPKGSESIVRWLLCPRDTGVDGVWG